MVVAFGPRGGGLAAGTLVIRTQEEAPVEVQLSGNGIDLPPEALFTMSCPVENEGNEIDPCADVEREGYDPASSQPEVFREQVVIGDEALITIDIKNKGCPNLVLSDIDIVPFKAGQTGHNAYSFVDLPERTVTLGADGQLTLKVRFAPIEGEANTPKRAFVTMKTNDAIFSEVNLLLMGTGSDPMIGIVPHVAGDNNRYNCTGAFCCDLAQLEDAENSIYACNGLFDLVNQTDPPVDVEVSSVTLEPLEGGLAIDDMFEIVTKPVGQTIPAGGKLTAALKLKYNPGKTYIEGQPNRRERRLIVTAKYRGFAKIVGGSPAQLDRNPLGKILNFNEDDDGNELELDPGLIHHRLLTMRNTERWIEQQPLKVSALSFTAPGDKVFSKAALEACAPFAGATPAELVLGQAVPVGEERAICIEFKSGATVFTNFDDELEFVSNAEESPLAITLSAATTCNSLPTAVASRAVQMDDCEESCSASEGRKTCAELKGDGKQYCVTEASSSGLSVGAGQPLLVSGYQSFDSGPDDTPERKCNMELGPESVVAFEWRFDEEAQTPKTVNGENYVPGKIYTERELVLVFQMTSPGTIYLRTQDRSGLWSAKEEPFATLWKSYTITPQ